MQFVFKVLERVPPLKLLLNRQKKFSLSEEINSTSLEYSSVHGLARLHISLVMTANFKYHSSNCVEIEL